MKQLEKILLATDFTKASDSALQMAISVAKTFNAEISLIHVIPDIFTYKKTFNIIKEDAEKNLEKRQNEITDNKVKLANTHLISGSPFNQIIKYADFHDSNLIIMGSGEKGNEEHFRLGITAHKVVRKSNKPVWIVRQDSTPVVKKILCPIDFSPPSRHALENAIHLARDFNAELTVLTVIEPLERDYVGLGVMPHEEKETYISYEQSLFDKFLKDFDFYKVKNDKDIREGKPAQEILKTISEKNIDVVIMGTIGKSAFTKVMMGSVTERVVRELPCSMITLKSEDAIKLRLKSDLENIEERFEEGKKLMEEGFDKEALQLFQLCLDIDLYFEPAWECSAIVYERLGKKEAAENSKKQAKVIRDKRWQQWVEAEIRCHHTIFGKHS